MADVVWIQFRYRRAYLFAFAKIALYTCVTCVRIFTWWFILISFHFHFALALYGCSSSLRCSVVVRVLRCLYALNIACDLLWFFFLLSAVRWSKLNALKMWMEENLVLRCQYIKTKPKKNLWHATHTHTHNVNVYTFMFRLCVCVRQKINFVNWRCVRDVFATRYNFRAFESTSSSNHHHHHIIIQWMISDKAIINNRSASLNWSTCSVSFNSSNWYERHAPPPPPPLTLEVSIEQILPNNFVE